MRRISDYALLSVGVESKPLVEPTHRLTKDDLKWLVQRRVELRGAVDDAGTLVGRMRDEDWGEPLADAKCTDMISHRGPQSSEPITHNDSGRKRSR